MLQASSRDANEPVPGFEPEPKTRFFGKFSNPEPVPEPEPESDFSKTLYPNPNPCLEVLKNFLLIFVEIFNFYDYFQQKPVSISSIYKKNNFSEGISLVF
jgi:hypothetical protein